jgi:small-conductance mechanosensitive channel
MARAVAKSPKTSRAEPAARTKPAPAAKKRATPSLALARDMSPEELRKELAAAQKRIAELEAQRAHLADRLTWVLDTLETLLAEEGG